MAAKGNAVRASAPVADGLPTGGLNGAGLGLRRALVAPLLEQPGADLDFLEVTPENWIGVGGARGKDFRRAVEGRPLAAHGLSLNIGGPAPLDHAHLDALKGFLDGLDVAVYSEHLSFCADDGQLYDLLPIPFTEEAVRYVAGRVQRVQEHLERPLALENVSYYAAPGQEMGEAEFTAAVAEEADCHLLLDVNNVYVNSANHGYAPMAFLDALPADRVAYLHIAGHRREAPDLLIDTHGAPVIDPVWDLLDTAYRRFGPLPTLLERDTEIPPLPELLEEVAAIRRAQERHAEAEA
ncbi:hypothetical protein AN478_10320 [Thiohalorhabdus denitrificans]|uniref:UPF0276 protein SAMN05661077_0972 n=1 Tax=Thiohalorhabdus denitrificans TaxID=381306 RepID=A0A0P9EB62_9GAMM|nr:hypothetical protein AN478_10320 [Thiohalorhabdus denitrificans]SCX99370.1 hypothetical protein SAMN05661077_0972 [Thiohalorhabdus denitrificans]